MARAALPAERPGFAAGNRREALDKAAALSVDELPVVRREAPGEIVGTASRRDVVNSCDAKTGG